MNMIIPKKDAATIIRNTSSSTHHIDIADDIQRKKTDIYFILRLMARLTSRLLINEPTNVLYISQS